MYLDSDLFSIEVIYSIKSVKIISQCAKFKTVLLIIKKNILKIELTIN